MASKKTVEIVLKTTLDDDGGGIGKVLTDLDKVELAVKSLNTVFDTSIKKYANYIKYIAGTTAALEKVHALASKPITTNAPKSTSSAANEEYDKAIAAQKAHGEKSVAVTTNTGVRKSAAEKQASTERLNNQKIDGLRRYKNHQQTVKNTIQIIKLGANRVKNIEDAFYQASLQQRKVYSSSSLGIDQSRTAAYIEQARRDVRAREKHAATILAINRRSGKYMESRGQAITKEVAQTNVLEGLNKSLLKHVFGVVLGYRAANAALNVMLRSIRSIPVTLIELQTTTAVFAATFGSAAGSAGAFKAINLEAERTGISINILRENFRNLHASMSLAGETNESTWRTFTSLNTVITALHLTGDKAQNVFLAIAQIFNKGKVQSEELTKQLGNLLPGAFASFAKSMGISTQQLSVQMQKGLVAAKKNVEEFAVYLSSRFNKAFAVASLGLQANLGRLDTASTKLSETLGTALEEPMLATVKAITSAINVLTNLIATTNILQNALHLLTAAGISSLVFGLIALGKYLLTSTIGVGAMGVSSFKTTRLVVGLGKAMRFLLSPTFFIAATVIALGYFATIDSATTKAIKRYNELKKAIEEASNVEPPKPVPVLDINVENDPAVIHARNVSDALVKVYEERVADLKRIRDNEISENTSYFDDLFKKIALPDNGFFNRLKLLRKILLPTDKEAASRDIKALGPKVQDSKKILADVRETSRLEVEAARAAAASLQSVEAKVELTAQRKRNKAKADLAYNKFMYDQNLISIQDYYAAKRILDDKAAQVEIDRLVSSRERAKLLAVSAATGAGSGANALIKVNDYTRRIDQLQDDLEAKQVKNNAAEATAQDKFHQLVVGTSVEVLKMQGRLVEADKLAITLRDRSLESGLQEEATGREQELAKARTKNYELMQANTSELVKLGAITRDLNIARQAYSNTSTIIEAKESTYRVSELESILARTEANKEYLASKEAIVLAAEAGYNAEADANGNIARSIAAMRTELEAFSLEANEMSNRVQGTLTDALGNSFKDFIMGAKSAGEAMKDFALSVLDSIAQIASNQLATSIIGGIFGLVGGGLNLGATSTLGTASTTAISGSPVLGTLDIGKALDISNEQGNVVQFARGGIPDVGTSPATFPMGTLREGGKPEAILPLKRNGQGDLGVISTGGSGGGIAIGTIQVNVVEREDTSNEEQSAAIGMAVRKQLEAMVDTKIMDATRVGNTLNPSKVSGVF